MAKTIPVVGEGFLGDNPYAMKVLKVKVGYASASPDVTILADTSAASLAVLTVPAGIIIHDLGWMVEEAFQANMDISVGVASDTVGWLSIAACNATVADTNVMWGSRLFFADTALTASLLPANVWKGGLYDTAKTLNVYFPVQPATITSPAGILDLFFVYSMAGTGVVQT
jgi:hypothetical protein